MKRKKFGSPWITNDSKNFLKEKSVIMKYFSKAKVLETWKIMKNYKDFLKGKITRKGLKNFTVKTNCENDITKTWRIIKEITENS